MKNEPQLSAEMEKRFKSWYSECGLDPEFDEIAMQHQQNGLQFLATALEEQRADFRVRVLSELYVMVEDNHIEETATNAGIWDDSMSGYNEAIEDILQQLREKIKEMQDTTPPATAEKYAKNT